MRGWNSRHRKCTHIHTQAFASATAATALCFVPCVVHVEPGTGLDTARCISLPQYTCLCFFFALSLSFFLRSLSPSTRHLVTSDMTVQSQREQIRPKRNKTQGSKLDSKSGQLTTDNRNGHLNGEFVNLVTRLVHFALRYSTFILTLGC